MYSICIGKNHEVSMKETEGDLNGGSLNGHGLAASVQ